MVGLPSDHRPAMYVFDGMRARVYILKPSTGTLWRHSSPKFSTNQNSERYIMFLCFSSDFILISHLCMHNCLLEWCYPLNKSHIMYWCSVYDLKETCLKPKENVINKTKFFHNLKSLSPIYFVKNRLSNFLGNEYLVKMYKL